MKLKNLSFVRISIFIIPFILTSCFVNKKASTPVPSPIDTLSTNDKGKGTSLEIHFIPGAAHNHPTMAIWIEDMDENFIQNLFVTQYLSTGVFGHASIGDTVWTTEPGLVERPAALPYWLYKYTGGKGALPTPDNPVPDAYTGATPTGEYVVKTRADKQMKDKFRLLMEINQPWDWNEYWTNNKYPLDKDYMTSCQPSVVYAVTINPLADTTNYYMNPIGHGHYSGKDGALYTDLSTLTTALDIAREIKVMILNNED